MPHGKIQFIITVGEESGLVGAKALIVHLLRQNMVMHLIVMEKSAILLLLHQLKQELRQQFLEKQLMLVLHLKKAFQRLRLQQKRYQKCRLGRIDEETTANIGRFEGGQATNIVCDHVEILAEARSLVPEKMEAQVQK